MAAEEAVALENITCEFPGVRALDSVTLGFAAGQVHAVAGENGAGKSTLLKVLAGLVVPVSGRVLVHGRSYPGVRHARQLGIRTIPQEPVLAPDLSIAENVYIGRLPRRPWGRIDWNSAMENTRGLLARVGLRHLEPGKCVRGLGMGERQLIQVARALSGGGETFLFDEPTSSLSRPEMAKLAEIICALRSERKVVVFVSHRLEEIFSICDSVSVLRDGRLVGTRPVSATSHDELIRMMVGRDLSFEHARDSAPQADTCLRVTLAGRSFEVRRGEIVGLAGLIGAGRTELLNAIFGVAPLKGASVTWKGKATQFESPGEAARAGLAYVPEDRKQHGLALDLSVADNFALPNLRTLSRLGFLLQSQKTKLARALSARLQVRSRGAGQKAGTLSGGNQQKVVVGKWLARAPECLLLDEPTRGVDVAAKAEIYRLIRELAAGGMAVLMSSSELPELLALSDRVVVMREGHISGELSRAEMSEVAVMRLATPGFAMAGDS
jgi:rhamnose transport system ATP-binding protein